MSKRNISIIFDKALFQEKKARKVKKCITPCPEFDVEYCEQHLFDTFEESMKNLKNYIETKWQ